MKEIEPAPNQHGNSAKGSGTPSSRKEAAEEAGFSPDQAKANKALADMPEEEFKEEVETGAAPTAIWTCREKRQKPSGNQSST